MAFFYNSTTKKFLFAPRETPPYVPGQPDEPSFGLIRVGDPGASDCCCCPCCSVPEGSQTYVCTNDTKKRRCINDGGTPNCSTPTCQPDTCCNGACCQGASCSITADIVCQQLGGVFMGCGTACSPTPCCSGACDEANPCPGGCYCCNGQCQPTPCCSGACDEANPCPEGCYCCNGQCQPTPCPPTCEGACDEANPCPEGCECCNGICIRQSCEPHQHKCDCECVPSCGLVFSGSVMMTTPGGMVVFNADDCFTGCEITGINQCTTLSWAPGLDCGTPVWGKIFLDGNGCGGWVRPLVEILCDCAGYATSASINGYLTQASCNGVPTPINGALTVSLCGQDCE
jgi:hypothetical protein